MAVPHELRVLAESADAFAAILRDITPALEQWADVYRHQPAYTELLMHVRHAGRNRELGTTTTISRLASELLETEELSR